MEEAICSDPGACQVDTAPYAGESVAFPEALMMEKKRTM